MILVAGGTGTLGSQVVRLLLERGEPVRVLTRDPARAAHLPESVQVLTGDLRDPAAVTAAVRGCATVVSAVHGFVGPGKPSPRRSTATPTAPSSGRPPTPTCST